MSALPMVAPRTFLREARPDDVPSMAALINGYAAQGLMLPKSEEALTRALEDFQVVVDGSGAVVGCGGLRVYSAESAEIVGLAVRDGWQGEGIGGVLVERLVDEAEERGVRRVFAMTLSIPFFFRHDFRPLPRELLPEKEQADCTGCPRRDGCREHAVQRVLHDDRAARLPSWRDRSRTRARVRSRRARMLRGGGR